MIHIFIFTFDFQKRFSLFSYILFPIHTGAPWKHIGIIWLGGTYTASTLLAIDSFEPSGNSISIHSWNRGDLQVLIIASLGDTVQTFVEMISRGAVQFIALFIILNYLPPNFLVYYLYFVYIRTETLSI